MDTRNESNVTETPLPDSLTVSYLANNWQMVSFMQGCLIKPSSFPLFLATAKRESIPLAKLVSSRPQE